MNGSVGRLVHPLIRRHAISSPKIRKVVLAYSGGLDTSVIIPWLKETYGCQVTAFCGDLGQGEDLKAVAAKARRTGAAKVVVVDLREIFVRDYVFPMLRAGAVYEGGYLLGTSIARPLLAKTQMEIAARERADAVAHGATGKGNDQVRFELAYLAIRPDIRIIAPWREWSFKSRQDLIAYAARHRIPVAATRSKPYSTDRNLFHISFEGGILENPWNAPPEDMFVMSVSPRKAPGRSRVVEIEYRQGNPVALDAKTLSPAKLLARLNDLGGANGVGRIDLVENRTIVIQSRGVYETPGGTILHVGRRAVESLTLDREVMHFRDTLIPRYAELVYNGYWFSPERLLIQRLMDEAQKPVTGTARVELYKGNCMVTGRKALRSLYRQEYATFEEDRVFNPRDAEGFIRLNALRLRIQSLIDRRRGGAS